MVDTHTLLLPRTGVPVKVVEVLPSPPEEVVGALEREGNPGVTVVMLLGEGVRKGEGELHIWGENVAPSTLALANAEGVSPTFEEGEGGEVRVPTRYGDSVTIKDREEVWDGEGVSIAPGGEGEGKEDEVAPPPPIDTVIEEDFVGARAVNVPPPAAAAGEGVGKWRLGELEKDGEDVVEGLPEPPVGVRVAGGVGSVEGVEDKLPPPAAAAEVGEVDKDAKNDALGASVKLGAPGAVTLRVGQDDTDPPPPSPPSPLDDTEGERDQGLEALEVGVAREGVGVEVAARYDTEGKFEMEAEREPSGGEGEELLEPEGDIDREGEADTLEVGVESIDSRGDSVGEREGVVLVEEEGQKVGVPEVPPLAEARVEREGGREGVLAVLLVPP